MVGGGSGQHFSSVQCSYSRQQRSPSQPAMRSACEVSACSVLTDINVPRGCALIQPSTARLARQIRCVCASPAWLEAQQDPFLCQKLRGVSTLSPVRGASAEPLGDHARAGRGAHKYSGTLTRRAPRTVCCSTCPTHTTPAKTHPALLGQLI